MQSVKFVLTVFWQNQQNFVQCFLTEMWSSKKWNCGRRCNWCWNTQT